MKPYPLLLALLLISASPLPQAGNEVVTKTHCTLAMGYTDLEKLKTDLLTGAKRLAVNELFGELIASSTAVKDFVVTSDQIKASSIGFVRLEGNVEFRNGNSLAEVCATIRGYATPQDREQFKPTKVAKRNCVTDPNLPNRELKVKADKEVIIKALEDFDPELVGQDPEKVLRLMQRVRYLESAPLPDTDTYCSRIEGEVIPIEVKALLELGPVVDETAPNSVDTGTSALPSSSLATIKSTFDGMNTDGWKVNRGSFSNPGSGGGCGADNGCLVFSERGDGITNWWIAPKEFVGDWRAYSKLRFDSWSLGGKNFESEAGDIYLKSGNAIAWRKLPVRPPEKWQTFEIGLEDDGKWVIEGAQNVMDVLANVTEFRIRAEYGDGNDTSGLDNVELIN